MHNMDIWTFPSAYAPAKVRKEIYQAVFSRVRDEYPNESRTESGWASMADTAATIRFDTAHHFDTVEAAKEWLYESDDGYFNGRAVLAAVPTNEKKVDAAKKALADAEKHEQEIKDSLSVKNRTSKFLGCEKCGSKIAREYLKGDKCPVCGNDLRPASTLDRIAAVHKKVVAARRKLEEAKNCKKKEVWVVFTDYHT